MEKRSLLTALFVLRFSLFLSVAQILPVTDPQMMRSLNGVWQLKVVEGIDENDNTVPQADNSWGSILVPGCWESHGFSKASYDQARALTGYYRTTFSIPRQWKGQRVAIRLDGVLYGYDLWLNGHYVGAWRSAYNTAVFDLTPFIDKKRAEQQLAMRVITRFPGSDFDYNDDWAPCGIFRDVTLMAVPSTHLSSLAIRTKNTGEVSVDASIANNVKGTAVTHEILDAQGNIVGTKKVSSPHLWTAETPYLYTLRTTLTLKGKPLQTFVQKFGFREVSIEGNVLKLNGQPIKLRGVTCHSTDPHTLKVISEELTLKDMRLMKEASVNYIRTSHYPREPRFYELADSLGFYIIDEVPFGYGDKNLRDTAFYSVLQQRAQATIERDRNHPSVIIWSLGNENPLTDICIRLGDYVHSQLDPSRPYCYPQVGSYFRRFFEGDKATGFPAAAPIYSPHYPTTEQIAGFYQHLDRPVIFTEYCHTLGISFEDHDRQWEIIERTPGIAGGSVWEWADQGAPLTSPLGGKPYGFEERVFYASTHANSSQGKTQQGPYGFEMHSNKGTDGLLYADRTPLPNYYELQHNYARALVTSVKQDARGTELTLNNRYDFIDLHDNVFFRWVLTADRDTVQRGVFTPHCDPHSTASHTLSLPATNEDKLVLLHLDIVDAQEHHFLQQSFVLNKPRLEWQSAVADIESLIQEGPLVRAGRKPTLAEKVTQKDDRLPKHYLLPIDNSQVKTELSQQTGTDGGEHMSFSLMPDTANVFRAELGLAFLLDASIDRLQWLGQGPFASYPGRHQACRYGIWSKQLGDLYLEGNHGGIDAALLTDSEGNGLLVVGDSLDLNFEQTDRGLVLTINAAVAGQGPKFRRTAFPTQADNTPHTASCSIYRVSAGQWPAAARRLFVRPASIAEPFHPYATQYDTYLMRFQDIVETEE